MLYRVSGFLTNGTPFSARIEGSGPVDAFVTGRKALNNGSVPDEDISEIRVRPIKGKSAVTFGKIKTPEEKAKAKADRAAKEAAKGKGGTAPAKVATAPAKGK